MKHARNKDTEIDPLIMLALAGHLTLAYEEVIAFHNQQLRILKQHIKRMPRLNKQQRARLAALYRRIDHRLRQAQETLVTPRTLMR